MLLKLSTTPLLTTNHPMKIIRINPADNVAVAISPLKKGETVNVEGIEITLTEDVPAGHKVLLSDLAAGENVIKYGYPIGRLTEDRKKGDFVCHNNIKTNLSGLLDYSYAPVGKEELTNPAYAEWFGEETATFRGYRRKNGEVGIRNEVWIVPTVGCVNGVVNQLADLLRKEQADADSLLSKMVEEGAEKLRIVAYPHNYGCSQLSDDHENTRKILRDLVLHPNAGAVLVVGLGCENNQPDKFEELLGDYDKERIRFMVTQKVEGDEVEAGMEILRELYAKAATDKREDVPLAELRVGLKCGGSDGFSGITANPLLGVFSDRQPRRHDGIDGSARDVRC